MTECQLIVDPPQPGTWNMAVDEWLLHRAADEGILALRFYQWSEPTLSLGYFQKHTDRAGHEASLELPLVRRASGGGALVHDRELTYSLAVPVGHPLAGNTQQLYDAAHRTLIDVLREMFSERSVPRTNGDFTLCGQTQSRGTEEPFLCFLRRAKGDVLFADASPPNATEPSRFDNKICGSAQRKHRGAVLQHGGVLLDRSPHAPELPGLAQLLSSVSKPSAITAGQLSERWIEPLGAALDLDLRQADSYSPRDRQAIAAIEAAKFANSAWTYRR